MPPQRQIEGNETKSELTKPSYADRKAKESGSHSRKTGEEQMARRPTREGRRSFPLSQELEHLAGKVRTTLSTMR